MIGELVKELYGQVGAPHPMLSSVVVFIIGGLLFVGFWWLMGSVYNRSMSEPEAQATQILSNAEEARIQNPGPPPSESPQRGTTIVGAIVEGGIDVQNQKGGLLITNAVIRGRGISIVNGPQPQPIALLELQIPEWGLCDAEKHAARA